MIYAAFNGRCGRGDGYRQSTLSRRLRDLELRVGTALFERTNGGTRPTIAGLEFLEFAYRILKDTEDTLQYMKRQGRGENGRLSIGVYASLATGNLRSTLAEYHRSYPDIDVHTVDGTPGQLVGALERGEVDIAVMTNWRLRWNDRSLALWTERVIVALPAHHHLASYETLTWRLLAPERFIFPQNGPGPELEHLFKTKINGERPYQVIYQKSGLDRLLSLVSVGYGLLLLLEGGTGLKHEGVVFREIQDAGETTRLSFGAYWRRSNQNPALQPLLGLLEERFPDFSRTIRQ